MNEPNDQLSGILTIQEIIKAWPDLAQTTYTDIRSVVLQFTTAVQELEKSYQPSEIDSHMLLYLINCLKEKCMPHDLGFVQAILKLAFPARNQNIFWSIYGFLTAFNPAYYVLQNTHLLESVKRIIQEAADPARSDIVQPKDKVHNMYSICVAFHLIS